MTGRASTNHSQASQTRLSWHKWTGQWNWINAFIAICGVVAGIVALWAAVKGLMLQIWTSRKDFFELCLEQQSAQRNISAACVETLQSIIPPPPSRVRLHRRWLPEYPQSLAYSIIINKGEVDFLLAAFIVVVLILFSSGIFIFVHLMRGTEFATISINVKNLVFGRARIRTIESQKELNFLEVAPSKMHSDGNIIHKLSVLTGTPSKIKRPYSEIESSNSQLMLYSQYKARRKASGPGGTQVNTSGKIMASTATASASVLVSGTGPNHATEVTGLKKRNMRNTRAKQSNLSEDADLVKPTTPVDKLSTAKLLLRMAVCNGGATATYNAAMMEAARQGYDSVLVFLRNKKPNIRGAGAENAVLMWAVMKNDHETVLERLTDGVTDADALFRRQMVSIYNSKETSRKSFARPTVEAGAYVNVADDKGRTPLMLMAEIGQVAAVELLLENGAYMDMVDSNQWSAIDYAKYGGHLKVVELLEHRLGEFRNSKYSI